MEFNRIYNEDCLDGMKRLPDNSIDLTVTSPPYDNLRTYNGYSFDFEGIARELYRVTKDGGVVVWVVGDATIKGSETGTSFRQALYFKEIGFNLHDTMIYQKSSQPRQKNRYEQQFEYMFVLSKRKPKTTNLIKILSKNANKFVKRTCRDQGCDFLKKSSNKVSNFKLKENVWFYGSKNNKTNHPAVFPEQLAYDHIISWSNEGDVVMDIFMGSGTTAKMAKKANRHYIGFEISEEYCKIAEERIQQECALLV